MTLVGNDSGGAYSQIAAASDATRIARLVPVLFACAAEDNFFPLENAWRYARELEQGRVEVVPDALSFTPEDQPKLLAEAIERFVRG